MNTLTRPTSDIAAATEAAPEESGNHLSFHARYQARVGLGRGSREARNRYEDYARHHDDFVDEVAAYLYGANPHQAFSLASLAWKMTTEMNRVGRTEYGWTWSPAKQREELAPGLLAYLQLICEILMPSILAGPTGVRYRPVRA